MEKLVSNEYFIKNDMTRKKKQKKNSDHVYTYIDRYMNIVYAPHASYDIDIPHKLRNKWNR